MDSLHEIGATGDGSERHATSDALRRGDQICSDPFVVERKPVPGSTEPRLDLISDEHHVVGSAPVGNGTEEPRCGHDEATFTLNGLDEHGSEVGRSNLRFELADGSSGCVWATQVVPERIRHGNAVDVGSEGSEAVLVGHVLRRQRHRQVGASVVGVVEHGNRWLARC